MFFYLAGWYFEIGMEEVKMTFKEFKEKIEFDKSQWFVYIVCCKDNTLYCGSTNDIENRLDRHNSGKGAKYINSKRSPVILSFLSNPFLKSEAMKEEYRIKKLKKSDKELLCKEWKNKQCNLPQ